MLAYSFQIFPGRASGDDTATGALPNARRVTEYSDSDAFTVPVYDLHGK